MSEELKQEVPVVDEVKAEEPKAVSVDDGVIKVDLGLLNKPETDAVPEQKADASDVPVEKPADTPSSEEVVEEVRDTIQVAESPIQEITEEEVAEKAEDLEEQVEQAIVEQNLGVKLPENIQKVVDFVNETGGSLEDFVKLNVDYDSLDEKQLLHEYYQASKPHLDREEVDFLMEDNFSYDEEIDEERDIRKKKIAKKEELSKAKKYLDEVKGKYYAEIKGGSKLLPEQKKAVEFFNRYTEENKEATKIAESQVSTFKAGTEKLFSNDFKGFDFDVSGKKFRYGIQNPSKTAEDQSNINNFVGKFLNDKGDVVDTEGYHKALYIAANADTIVNHFYEQGKADAVRDVVNKSKNITDTPRTAVSGGEFINGLKVKSISCLLYTSPSPRD